MTTMMQHPQHGKHPATGHEVEHMKTLGWAVCPPKVKEVPQEAEVAAAPEIAFLDGVTAAVQTQIDNKPAPKRRGPNKPKAK